jgi:amino acid adenylation domain-containing protein
MSTAPGADSSLADKRRALLALMRQREDVARKVRDRLGPRPETAPPPLSFAQQRLWFLDRLVPGSPFYNVPGAVRVRAPVDAEVLRATYNEIVRRHEVLRTAFSEVDGKPFQLILPHVEVPLTTIDLRHLPAAVREQEAARLAEEDARTPFDLRQVPLFRIALLCLDDSDYVFLINLHHILADGWSIGVLVAEAKAIYAAFAQGLPSPLPPLKIQYADFARWQRRQVEGGHLDAQFAYWAQRLAGLPVLQLPTDFPHRGVRPFEGETLLVTLPVELTEQIKQFSRHHDVTVFVTLLAAFNALLHRYTGQDDIVIGIPIANRNRVEVEPLIGFFVNSLVLRTDLTGDPTFAELLHRSRDVALGAVANEDLPFEVLVERLRPERSMSRNPLFQVSLQFFSGAEARGRSAVVSGDAIHVEKGTAGLDLAFDLIESDAGLLARVEYSTELFRAETIRRMTSHYQNLLQAFVRNPDLRVSEAPMLSPAEADEALNTWGTGPQPGPPAGCVHELFERQARANPGLVALEWAGGELSYGELSEGVRRLAELLRATGVGPEKVVAVCVPRSPELIRCLFATWAAGGAYLPLDPTQPPSRLAFLVADARPHVVLTTPEYRELAAGLGVPLVLTDADPGAADPACPTAGPENLAYVIYTSGSTGVPKGVMVEHGALARHLLWMQDEFPLGPDDRGLFKYSPNFDVSLLEVCGPLLAGARVHVPDPDSAVDPTALARVIRDRGVTVLDVIPSMLAVLLDVPAFAAARSLRRVVCGGEAMPPDLLARLTGRMDVEFCNMYGPTEASISATYWRGGGGGWDGERVPIGRPVGHARAYVLDGDLNPLPPLVQGELYVGGECLARGYLGRPEWTRGRFVRDPFARDPFARLYRTGDRCRLLPDGTIDFLGRVDDQVKVRGHRIELAEVEAAMASSALVRACAAAVRDDPQGQGQLVAYVVPNTSDPELWPSVGEYSLYDDLLYHVMTTDRFRNRAYRRAIEKVVSGRTVVDVGTGADLALTRMCLDAGARRVYAIEMLDRAVDRARRLADDLGIGDRLAILHGDSRRVELPEKVDVCVSELIGMIGSSEGAIDVINDARRFLKPGGVLIPDRCVTWVAAVSLPGDLATAPRFNELPGFYAERVFASVGRRFDLRVCVKNLPAAALLSGPGVFEDLSFRAPIPREATSDVELRMTRAGRLDGLLLWVDLSVDPDERIDVLRSETNWLPVFLPVFSPGVEVQAGDTITLACTRLAEVGEIIPDYVVRGMVTRRGRPVVEFNHESSRNETACGASPFYRALHQAAAAPVPSSRAAAERLVDDWKQLYEDLYTDPERQLPDPEFNTVGWNSSYTGRPLGEADLREQVEATVGRIRQLDGRRVWEQGCGTGLLTFRLAPGCDHYLATDFSPAAITAVRTGCDRLGLTQVATEVRRADDCAEIDPGSADGVVLNSVVQYFPDAAYLDRVLAGAARAVRPGGWVFVGDVLCRRLAGWLHAGVELGRAADDTPAAEVSRRAAKRAAENPELTLDPGYFAAWAAAQPGPTGVAVEVKRGRCDNELTRFRYDVILWVGAGGPTVPAWDELAWGEVGSVTALGAYLRERRPAGVVVHRIPSGRLAGDRRLVELLERAKPGVTAEDVRREVAAAAGRGIQPEDLWELERECGYWVRVGWSESDGHYDAWCVPRDGRGRWDWSPPADRGEHRPPAYGAPASGPGTSRQELDRRLREHLQDRLPGYMMPTHFTWVDGLPVTATGKLDRGALSALETQPSEPPASYVPPKEGLEKQIAEVWGQVLATNGVGADDNFFTSGGHSLLAIQVMSRLSVALGVDVPLRMLFDRPTIASLAGSITELLHGAGRRTADLAPASRDH